MGRGLCKASSEDTEERIPEHQQAGSEASEEAHDDPRPDAEKHTATLTVELNSAARS